VRNSLALFFSFLIRLQSDWACYDVDWACYDEHRQICPLQPISLYFGWIRCGHIKVRYLPERVLRQLCYVQTIPRPPAHSVAVATTQIDFLFVHFMNQVLTAHELGTRALYLWLTTPDYITWYMKISHPYLELLPTGNLPKGI
jgi:hypothetical protein